MWIIIITAAITAANAIIASPPVDQISHLKASMALCPVTIWARYNVPKIAVSPTAVIITFSNVSEDGLFIFYPPLIGGKRHNITNLADRLSPLQLVPIILVLPPRYLW